MGIRESIPALGGLDISGKYTIDLCDERGRVRDRRVVDNYITPLIDPWAKIRTMASFFPYGFPWNDGGDIWRTNDVSRSVSGRGVRPLYERPLPLESLILTDSGVAEDSDDSWLTGDVIAWATMWKANVSASGKRGQINEAECLITNDRVFKYVWDWTTGQGNGEYQTLAIGAMNRDAGNFICNTGPGWLGHSNTVGDTGWQYVLPLTYNPKADKWVMGGIPDQDDTLRFYVADGDDSAMLAADNPYGIPGRAPDLAALSWGSEINSDFAYTSDSTNTISAYVLDWYPVIALSGDAPHPYVAAWSPASSGRFYLQYLDASGVRQAANDQGFIGTGNLQTDNRFRGTRFSCMEIGTNIYAACEKETFIGRFTYGTTAPVHDANIPFPSEITGTLVQAVTDGTDIYVLTTSGLYKMGTDGSYKGNYGHPLCLVPDQDEQLLDPYYDNSSEPARFKHTVYGNTIGFLEEFTSDSSITAQFLQGPSSTMFERFDSENPQKMLFWNNRLWLDTSYKSGNPHSDFEFVQVEQGNMFSRVLLDSPITKGASATMKISYELTFPDPYDLIHPDVALPF